MRIDRGKIILLFVSTFIGLLLAEIVVRVLFPQAGWRQFRDVGLGWSSKEYRSFAPEPEEKQVTAGRILFLGDSYLAGAGLKHLGERFPILFKEKSGPDIEVRIFASAGWGTDQEFLAFIQKGKQWKPDLVVLAFCANNDLGDITSTTDCFHSGKPYFALDDRGNLGLLRHDGTRIESFRGVSAPPGFRRVFQVFSLDLLRYVLLKRKSAAPRADRVSDPRYVRDRCWDEKTYQVARLLPELDWSPQNENSPVSAFIHENFEKNSYQWTLLEAILKNFKREVEGAGAEFVVMLLPASYESWDIRFMVGGSMEHRFPTPDGEFTFRAAEPRERLGAICERQGIHWFDPTAEFIDTVMRNNLVEVCWLYQMDRHFSRVGHSILADQFRQYLNENPELLDLKR